MKSNLTRLMSGVSLLGSMLVPECDLIMGVARSVSASFQSTGTGLPPPDYTGSFPAPGECTLEARRITQPIASGHSWYRSQTALTVAGTVAVAADAELTLQSPQILFEPGFRVASGARLSAVAQTLICPDTGLCGAAQGQLFGADYPWNQRIDTASLDAESASIIEFLQTNHISSQRFRIDGPSDVPNNTYGMTRLSADASTAREAFTPTMDHYSPDCDTAPVPIPAGGAIEGEDGYACESDGDCHLIVTDTDACRLYEMWRANREDASHFEGGCLAVWDLNAPYQSELRGEYCTSADAAGLPIAAHMFSADDIAVGEIRHAIRFILPNDLMRERVYVRPATHSTPSTSGPASAPPYGARLRLKADFDMSRLSAPAQVVARALQAYGMILSDGGNITFTALNDRFTEHTWSEVDLMPNDLTALEWTDFEVVELGERFYWDGDCLHTPVTN